MAIDSNGKLTYHGDWPNISKYVYVDPDGTGGAGSGNGYNEIVDINYDGSINILDIVELVNIILN